MTAGQDAFALRAMCNGKARYGQYTAEMEQQMISEGLPVEDGHRAVAQAERPDFEGAKYVMSPPLRDKRNQSVLCNAIRQGQIATVATDHAPFDFATARAVGAHERIARRVAPLVKPDGAFWVFVPPDEPQAAVRGRDAGGTAVTGLWDVLRDET